MLPTVTTTLQTVLMIFRTMATQLTNKSGEFLDGVMAHINALKTLKKI